MASARRRFQSNHGDDGQERSDFPIVCQTCLGPNPYVRMIKSDYGKECKVCTRPFTVFKWKSGPETRYKSTQICQTCTKLKNVCQVCELCLKSGLPVQARDALLGINSSESVPKSDVNREYYAKEHDRRARAGMIDDSESSYGKACPNDTILKQLERTTPYYKRNRARICSFYVRGECKRGLECAFRHEMPESGELPRQNINQNIKDRYHGVNDPVALKLLQKAAQMSAPKPPEDDQSVVYNSDGAQQCPQVPYYPSMQQYPPPPAPYYSSMQQHPPPPAPYYPSMDPQRMGAVMTPK